MEAAKAYREVTSGDTEDANNAAIDRYMAQQEERVLGAEEVHERYGVWTPDELQALVEDTYDDLLLDSQADMPEATAVSVEELISTLELCLVRHPLLSSVLQALSESGDAINAAGVHAVTEAWLEDQDRIRRGVPSKTAPSEAAGEGEETPQPSRAAALISRQ